MANVAHLEGNEVTSAKLAVDAKIEERELAHALVELKANSERPDVLRLERRLLPDNLALVPRFAVSGVGCSSHDGLPSS